MKKNVLVKYVAHASISGLYAILSGAVIIYCEWKKHKLEQGRDELGNLILPEAIKEGGISLMNTVGTHLIEVSCGWMPLAGAVLSLALSTFASLIIMDKHDEPTSSYKGCMVASTIFIVLNTVYIILLLVALLFVLPKIAK